MNYACDAQKILLCKHRRWITVHFGVHMRSVHFGSLNIVISSVLEQVSRKVPYNS